MAILRRIAALTKRVFLRVIVSAAVQSGLYRILRAPWILSERNCSKDRFEDHFHGGIEDPTSNGLDDHTGRRIGPPSGGGGMTGQARRVRAVSFG
jgi:hypothetical protein